MRCFKSLQKTCRKPTRDSELPRRHAPTATELVRKLQLAGNSEERTLRNPRSTSTCRTRGTDSRNLRKSAKPSDMSATQVRKPCRRRAMSKCKEAHIAAAVVLRMHPREGVFGRGLAGAGHCAGEFRIGRQGKASTTKRHGGCFMWIRSVGSFYVDSLGLRGS